MGYEDPGYLINQLAEIASRLQSLVKRGAYDDLPGEIQDGFFTLLDQQVRALATFTQALEYSAHMARSERSGGRFHLPNGEAVTNLYSVAGMPVLHVRSAARGNDPEFTDYVPAPTETEVAIYLDEYTEDQLEAVQAAAFALADELGYHDFSLTQEQRGSIFRRFLGKLKSESTYDYVKEKMQELDARASIELVGRAQAETNSIRVTSAANLIASLAAVPNAVVRVSGVLVVKQTDAAGVSAVILRDLTMREQRALELNPGIQQNPREVLQLLALAVAGLEDD